MGPFFSIITVALNDLAGLRDTWESVASQTVDSREWIVVDGGSTDGSLEFLRSLRDGSTRWSSEPDGGIFDAMNHGIDRAAGRYLWFMNAGDSFAESRTLETVIDAITADGPVDLLYGDALERRSDGTTRLRPARPATSMHRGMFTHHQAMIFRRSFVGSRRYDTSYRLSGDYAFVANLLHEPHSEVRYLPVPLCVFKLGGISERRRRMAIVEDARVRSEVLGMGTALVLALSVAHRVHLRLKRRFPEAMAMQRRWRR